MTRSPTVLVLGVGHFGAWMVRALLDELVQPEPDLSIVSLGGDLTTAVLAVQTLDRLHVPDMRVKVESNEEARALEAVGADDVIFPDRDAARWLVAHIAP